jgi:hypothetical protein
MLHSQKISKIAGCLSFLLLMPLSPNLNGQNNNQVIVNSTGMRLIPVSAGSFMMGENNPTPASLGGPEYLTYGDWDEHPVHRVTISTLFYMSETEVTIEQFRQFRPDYQGLQEYAPYAAGISWYDAVAFCQWLSKKEGKPYRLPTEAEWEYACRSGSTSLFALGDTLAQAAVPNTWGLKNMQSGVREWCLDWHGMYPETPQMDPVGPDWGFAKVVRGGGIDRNDPYYCRSANRAGIAPDFPPAGLGPMQKRIADEWGEAPRRPFVLHKAEGVQARESYPNFVRDVLGNQGNHPIGFRVVQAPAPGSTPIPTEMPFVQQCVRQICSLASQQVEKPYFQIRHLIAMPPDNTPPQDLSAIHSLGIHPALLGHNHSPALEVCPNGDLLAVYYTSVSETAPDVALMAIRLRFGHEEWDMPDLFLDFPDVDDHAPLLWNDNGTICLFWGANKLASGFPFQWTTSVDNGVSWSQVRFPIFETPVGPHSAQPINTAFRDKSGKIYIASDAEGAESVLWSSSDNGVSWRDPGGRTGGRHTTFVLLKDGRILGMGGKSSDIDGYMPESFSSDGGETWQIEQSPFSSLGSNQRPSVLRLASGRLFFAADMQRTDGFQPQTLHQRGVCVALSNDEGKTWIIIKLPGALQHENPKHREKLQGATIGYSVARQAPNGIIHLITSMTEPILHFAFNESWLLQMGNAEPDSTMAGGTPPATVTGVKTYEEKYPNGKIRAKWDMATADNGLVVLHGKESWYYENGGLQWESLYNMGRKIGRENYWSPEGVKLWSWEHRDDNTDAWIQWWHNGQKKSESLWHNGMCQGTATLWDQEGRVIQQYMFTSGKKTKGAF